MARVFSAGQRNWVCVCLCVCVVCVQRKDGLQHNLPGVQPWVSRRNHRELSQHCPCMFTRCWGSQFCQLPYCLTVFLPPSPTHAWWTVARLDFMILQKHLQKHFNSLKKAATNDGLIYSPPPLSVFLSVSLSFLVLTQINHRLKFSDGSVFFLGFCESSCK